jgi:hypothetical protein
MHDDWALNVPQQIFILFYAITWGTAANSQPRWKAFAWGAIRADVASMKRAWLSVAVLNVLPLLYFVLILRALHSAPWWASPWTFLGILRLLASISPAFAPFGFYRIWTAIVAWLRESFYGLLSNNTRPPIWDEIGIGVDPITDLNPIWAAGNLFWGFVYVLLGPVLISAVWCLSRC